MRQRNYLCVGQTERERELLKSGECQKKKIKQVFIILPAYAVLLSPII